MGGRDTFLRAREEVAEPADIHPRRGMVGRKSTNGAIESSGARVVYRYPALCIFPRGVRLPYSARRPQHARAETAALEAWAKRNHSPRKFLFVCASICEFAMVMRSGTGGTLEGAYNFFPLSFTPRPVAIGSCGWVGYKRSEISGKLYGLSPRNWSMPITGSSCRSCFIRRARFRRYSFSNSPINLSFIGRAYGRREETRGRPYHTLFPSFSQSVEVEKFSAISWTGMKDRQYRCARPLKSLARLLEVSRNSILMTGTPTR